MTWVGKVHPLERAVEWGAPAVFALGFGWATAMVGMPLAVSLAAALVALTVGVVAMRLAGAATHAVEANFEPAEFDPIAAKDELLLDDPLVEVTPDARVVRLFERDDPTPGELVLRISDYLSEQGRPAPEPFRDLDRQLVDASAALHAALANIRSTLR